MQTQQTFGSDAPFASIVADIASALGERPDEAAHQQAARVRTVTQTVLEFRPADVIEAMLAGRCVVFHELTLDSVHATLRSAEEDRGRRATRGSIVALDKAFGDNLARLERYRSGEPEAAKAPKKALSETAIADRVRRHQAASVPAAPAVSDHPEPVEATHGDPFPEADTSTTPSVTAAPASDEAEPAAPMALNRQARRALRRLAARHAPAIRSLVTARTAGNTVTPTRNAPATTISATPAG